LFLLLGFVIQPVVAWWARAYFPAFLAHVQARLPFEAGCLAAPAGGFPVGRGDDLPDVDLEGRLAPFIGIPAAVGMASLLFGLAHLLGDVFGLVVLASV